MEGEQTFQELKRRRGGNGKRGKFVRGVRDMKGRHKSPVPRGENPFPLQGKGRSLSRKMT